jgi:hypothetical protein
MREYHIRFCERLEVKVLRPTHLNKNKSVPFFKPLSLLYV